MKAPACSPRPAAARSPSGLRAHGAVTVAEVEERFGVSPMTARRDLAELERRGVVRRTHGGAVLPTISAHEDSFARRLEVDAEDKTRLAVAAVDLLTPRETIFLDSSTTTYYVAQPPGRDRPGRDGADQLAAGHGAAVQARAGPGSR